MHSWEATVPDYVRSRSYGEEEGRGEKEREEGRKRGERGEERKREERGEEIKPLEIYKHRKLGVEHSLPYLIKDFLHT